MNSICIDTDCLTGLVVLIPSPPCDGQLGRTTRRCDRVAQARRQRLKRLIVDCARRGAVTPRQARLAIRALGLLHD
jgi:hypothetical protein